MTPYETKPHDERRRRQHPINPMRLTAGLEPPAAPPKFRKIAGSKDFRELVILALFAAYLVGIIASLIIGELSFARKCKLNKQERTKLIEDLTRL